MSYAVTIFMYTFALLVGMLVLVGVGRRLGRQQLARDADGVRAAAGPVEAAAFGLYGLLIAFTFSGAAGRFDDRRRLVVDEANAIGTAYLRLDLLPAEARAALQGRFRQYLDSRLEIYHKLPDLEAAQAALDRSNAVQAEIWTEANRAAQGSLPATLLLLPALNSMIDITTTRTAATMMHPPEIIYGMLFLFSLGCALLVGYSMATARSFNLLHTTAFMFVTATSVFVILNLEYPRMGLIRVDPIDKVLLDLRASMK